VDFTAYRRQIGQNIKRARLAAGLSQQELASRTMTYKYLQSLEAGERDPKVSTLFALARHLDTTVAALTETDPKATARALRRMADAKPLAVGRKPKSASS
jgi:transcriptional regulator with XRE-family HTH domain